jgi:LacI family transcriptional regulator
MTEKNEITIYDLAKHLSVSAATVSRALNNHPGISVKTKKRISALAEEMGYRQNDFAKNLRNRKSHTIGIIVHELDSHFITSVLSGIEQILTESNYDIIIGHSAEAYEREVSNARNLFHKRVDGLIASLAYDTQDLSHYSSFFQKGIPVVFFDRVRKEELGTKVVIDNEKAGYEATMHLIQQGCKRIMHITGNLTQKVYQDRLRGFESALLHKGLPMIPSLLIVNDLSESAAIAVGKKILKMKNKPDGLFIANDFCAAVCMQTLKEGGLKVPQDIAIVGFNNDKISRVVEPNLSTIQYDGAEMGQVAASTLLDQLKNGSPNPNGHTIVLRHRLIVRYSSLLKR